MSSIYNNENILMPVNGFIDFDENGNIVTVSTSPTKPILSDKSNKRKAYDNYIGPGDYECNICHKKFVRKSYWKRHELSHDEKFSCEICGAEFMHTRHLNQHMNIHKEKQYECDICGKKITFSFNFKKHRKIHMQYKDENGDIKYLTIK